MPDNRELVEILLLASAITAVLIFEPSARSSVRNTLPIIFGKAILFPLTVLSLWIVGLVALGAYVGFWNGSLATDTAIWFFGSAIVTFFSLVNESSYAQFTRKNVRSLFAGSVFLAFFLGLHVPTFWIELIFQVALILVGLTGVVAGLYKETRKVQVIAGCAMIAIVLPSAVLVVYDLWRDWDAVLNVDAAREFFLPIWLTLGTIPMFLLLIGYIRNERFWRQVQSRPSSSAGLRAAIAIFTTSRLNHGRLNRPWADRIAGAGSFVDTRRELNAYREWIEEGHRQREEEQAKLVANAGKKGADPDGRQLDQREFAETKKWLRNIHTAQMGSYNQHGHYRDDIVSVFESPTSIIGLPPGHGIQLYVTEDGQAWWAWRRTITGWCFAIGANKPTPNEWLYDGSEPPTGFPGEDEAWGEPFGFDAANWHL